MIQTFRVTGSFALAGSVAVGVLGVVEVSFFLPPQPATDMTRRPAVRSTASVRDHFDMCVDLPTSLVEQVG
jgi:hypothetical protein